MKAYRQEYNDELERHSIDEFYTLKPLSHIINVPKTTSDTIRKAANYVVGMNLENVRDPSATSAFDFWIDDDLQGRVGSMTYSCQSRFN